MTRGLALGFAVILAACGGDDKPADGGTDAPAAIDGGAPDATVGPDATPCNTCHDILQGNGNPPLCPGSEALFLALNDCTCGGACMDECGTNVCMRGAPDGACTACLQDPAAGCGNEYTACSQDM